MYIYETINLSKNLWLKKFPKILRIMFVIFFRKTKNEVNEFGLKYQ